MRNLAFQGNSLLVRFFSSVVFALLCFVSRDVAAQGLQVLHHFGGPDGDGLYGGMVVRAPDGTVYGTTAVGGNTGSGRCTRSLVDSGCGTIFKIPPNDVFTQIQAVGPFIRDGNVFPQTPIIRSDGSLWVTFLGNQTPQGALEALPAVGIVPVTANSPLTGLRDDNCVEDGATYGAATMIFGADGGLWGTTLPGRNSVTGQPSNCLPWFWHIPNPVNSASRVGLNSTFGGSGWLVQGTDGNFYGSTPAGGPNGSIFKMSTTGVATTLHVFSGGAEGRYPQQALVQGRDGNFYGVTPGGTQTGGTIFRMTPAGVLTTIYAFTSRCCIFGPTNPSSPLALGRDGNFYGTTHDGGPDGAGTIYRVTPEGVVTVLYAFPAGPNSQFPAGFAPSGSIVVTPDVMYIYGTTEQGGANDKGVVYKFPIPPTVGDAPTLPQWAVIVLGALLLVMIRIVEQPKRGAIT